ncbi:CRR6 family NdhI maturation factor [Chamaesiphon sp. OTE_20_metabat_361]|uniref:CRR6 family NdhI maturation factor n=1 Tax=Chamaesiphon sp. OTE_20_metabat_361 TaxID=2964689 RepID=UPI00286C1B91|nr:CRR6 family NdhI maturation factor [Chamaesiphon sp. OTE_20_metabat_361]
MTTLKISDRALLSLDLSEIAPSIDRWLATEAKQFDLDLTLAIEYDRDPQDPRELSEIAEVRLWFIRLDACYPYLPLLLDWQAGELARYVAMLVPHQFSRKDGIQYNPEALEIWVMYRVFLLTDWLQHRQIEDRSRLKFMTQMLGYELDDGLFELLESPDKDTNEH